LFGESTSKAGLQSQPENDGAAEQNKEGEEHLNSNDIHNNNQLETNNGNNNNNNNNNDSHHWKWGTKLKYCEKHDGWCDMIFREWKNI